MSDPPRSGAGGGETGATSEPTRPGDALLVLPLAGLPEVRPGDDLPGLVADAVAATPGALPLRADDVIVVTQKVVSKAEGALVDLRTVEPRPEAVAFAARWQRDPRQVEVVLREAVRVVRMANGVIIAETRHGFVLANAGVDASNVGPGSGASWRSCPRDPDASARRIRDGLAARFGVAPGVVVIGQPGAAVALRHHRRRDRRRRLPAARGPAGRARRRRPGDGRRRSAPSPTRSPRPRSSSSARPRAGRRPSSAARRRPPATAASAAMSLMPPEVDLFR